MNAAGGSAPGNGIRVVDARLFEREATLRAPLVTSRGPVRTRRVRTLVLRAQDGTLGLGDASAVDWLAAAPSPFEAAAARFLERARADEPPAGALLHWSLHDRAAPSCLRAAVQTALVDLEARRAGLPLAQMLAGRTVASTLPLSALVLATRPEAVAREAAGYVAAGLASFKLKVGAKDLADDLARVWALRGAIGDDAELRLDANGAWEIGEARAALEGLAPARPRFVEEPLRDARLVSALDSDVAIALDESLHTAGDIDAAASRGGVRAVVLKLERCGGPLAALAMASRAAARGLDVVWTDSIDAEVGRAATQHAAAAAAARSGSPAEAVGLGGLFLLERAGLEPGALEPGAPSSTATLPGASGLGIEVAEATRDSREVLA